MIRCMSSMTPHRKYGLSGMSVISALVFRARCKIRPAEASHLRLSWAFLPSSLSSSLSSFSRSSRATERCQQLLPDRTFCLSRPWAPSQQSSYKSTRSFHRSVDDIPQLLPPIQNAHLYAETLGVLSERLDIHPHLFPEPLFLRVFLLPVGARPSAKQREPCFLGFSMSPQEILCLADRREYTGIRCEHGLDNPRGPGGSIRQMKRGTRREEGVKRCEDGGHEIRWRHLARH